MDLHSRWPLDEALYQDLVARYREPHRRYHTLQHLEECFARFDELRALAEHPRDVELAIWFHDAIYDTRRSDNDASADRCWKASRRGRRFTTPPPLCGATEKQARENLARSLARR